MSQTDKFIDGEGDAWLRRNIGKQPASDPVMIEIMEDFIVPRSVLEIGCSDGWRLRRIEAHFRCDIFGIDPSSQAVELADHPNIKRGVASHLPFPDRQFDLVIFGFCLYLCEPRDLFDIVSEADRVLEDGGKLIIYDFCDIWRSFAREYVHCKGVYSYHMDHSKFWLAHPWYRLTRRKTYGENMVTILRKLEHIPVSL